MEEFLLKTQYIVGSMFLLTGCLMYFLERLVSSAVHISGNFVNENTLRIYPESYILSFSLIIIGGILIAIAEYRRNKNQGK